MQLLQFLSKQDSHLLLLFKPNPLSHEVHAELVQIVQLLGQIKQLF
jgi:hypothetical protein